MMYVFSGVTGMDSNHFGSRSCLEFFRPGGSDEYLRRREEAWEVYEVAQGRNLSNGLDGTFTEDSEET